MFKKISRLLKGSAYVLFIGYMANEVYYITVNTSYLNTGQSLGVVSMFQMIWACFIGFIFSIMLYALGEIVEYYENQNSKSNSSLDK